MVDVDLLMKLISESGMKISAVCEKSGIERRTLWNRLSNGKSYLFNVREIEGLSKTLHMNADMVQKVFFAKKREKNSPSKEKK